MRHFGYVGWGFLAGLIGAVAAAPVLWAHVGYSDSEERIGRGIRGRRSEVILATKGVDIEAMTYLIRLLHL